VATSFQLLDLKGPTKLLRIWMTLSFAIQVESYKLQPITFGPIPLQHLHTVLSMWSCTVKLFEEKSKKCAGLAQKIVFAQYNCTLCGGWYKAQQATTCTCRTECNEYDLTSSDQCFWFAHHNDWSRWFAIGSIVPHFYLLSKFRFYGWGCQKVYN